MKLEQIKIRNFRGYHGEVVIDCDDMTVLVGQNDVGKSTILEALDIFFNEGKGIIKLDLADLNVDAKKGGYTDMEISCVFSDLPESIVIDDSNETSFKKDYMLNKARMLEVVKRYTMEQSKTKQLSLQTTVNIRAEHPTNKKCRDLLSKTQGDLQKLVEETGIPCDDARKNASLRAAIWKYYENELELKEVLLDISSAKSSRIWDSLRAYLPVYSLFQADRKNCDSDSEVQDPLKEAVKAILNEREIRETLDNVAEKVRERLRKVSDATLTKLKEMSPKVAQTLQPQIPEPSDLKWTDVFRKGLSITGDQDIPINKRGSGVKRLILLNFFRAEAEKKMEGGEGQSIIYAIEEPETSQHISNQILIINALKSLSQRDDIQVVLTTHSPHVVKCLDSKNIRIVKKSGTEREIQNAEKSVIGYSSLNEINFLAYGYVSEEYHNELYGELQRATNLWDIAEFDKELFNKWKCPQDKKWINEKNGKEKSYTIHTYIRHCIHHPENDHNTGYTDEEIKKSIEKMRWLLANNRHNCTD